MKKLKIILQSKYFYLILLFISLFFSFIFTNIIKYKSVYENENNFTGEVLDYKIDGNKISITFFDKEKLIGTYYIKNIDDKNYFQDNLIYGSKINIVGQLSDPSNNTIPNNFNYKKYLYNKKIYKLVSISEIKIDNSNISLINKIKNNLNNSIKERNNSEYIKTFIIGDKSGIDIDDYENYQKLGVTHLFAISGMHITLFSSSILFILNKLKTSKKVAIDISIAILFLYGYITNFPPSIKRAFILYSLLSINNIYKLDIKNIYLLLLTISINIFIDPFILYDIGFLYSISTTFGLLLSSKRLTGNYFIKLFKVSIIAFLFSLPITINNFYEINVLTPINNIIIVPLVSIIIYPLSILTLIFPFINPVLTFFINILLSIQNNLISINNLNIIIPKMPIILIILYYFILYLYIFKNTKFIILLMIIVLISKYIIYLDSDYYIYYFNVGQGDSSLIISPYKKNVYLIDTGGKITYKIDDWKKTNTNYHLINNTITFLKSIGINSINLVITHGDFDHMGEAINLVNNFNVEKVIFNCGPYNDLEKDLIKTLNKKKIPYYSCIKELNVDDNKLYFLQTKEYDNENDNSNVIYTELNNYKFLFMGDASTTTEKEILSKYNLSDVDVLKVGHHGSKTSSSENFINEINPKYSIISVGKNNRYGHPNKEVLNNLKDSKMYRTDEDGSIMFKIKNNKLKIETCSP